MLAAIHEFVPALPWYVYVFSQALVHLGIMRRFGAHLARTCTRILPAPRPAVPASGTAG